MGTSQFRIGVVAACLKKPDPKSAVAAAVEVGAECLQLYDRRPAGTTPRQWAEAWQAAVAGQPVAIASAVTGFPQEDYSTIQAIHRTGGLVPDDVADANVQRVVHALDFAAALGVTLLTFHAGFIPESEADPVFAKLRDRLARCADAAAERGLRIGLESGQESAAALARFLAALGRPNVGCNFDPGNLILYGRQQPLEAVEVLGPHILQVHAKDATWSDRPGETWGREVALGQGAVDFPRLLAKLRDAGFDGDLIIEREAGPQPLADIAAAVKLLRNERQAL